VSAEDKDVRNYHEHEHVRTCGEKRWGRGVARKRENRQKQRGGEGQRLPDKHAHARKGDGSME